MNLGGRFFGDSTRYLCFDTKATKNTKSKSQYGKPFTYKSS